MSDQLPTIQGHIGGFIKRRRIGLGLSLQGLADQASASKAHIWDLERGASRNPTIAVASRLCEALQCSWNELLGVDVAAPYLTEQELALIAAHRAIFKTNA